MLTKKKKPIVKIWSDNHTILHPQFDFFFNFETKTKRFFETKFNIYSKIKQKKIKTIEECMTYRIIKLVNWFLCFYFSDSDMAIQKNKKKFIFLIS